MNDETLSDSKADLLRLMKRRGEATVKELSRALSLAPSTIRQHLTGLQVDGFVQQRLKRQGVGRPSTVYSLTEKAQCFFENHESKLLGKLLGKLLDAGEQDRLERLFSSHCQDLETSWKRGLDKTFSENRIQGLQSLLEEWGYMPEIRLDEEQRLIIELFHCPYPNVSEVLPYQCACEKSLLEKLTGTSLRWVCHMNEGARSCCFKSSEVYSVPEK